MRATICGAFVILFVAFLMSEVSAQNVPHLGWKEEKTSDALTGAETTEYVTIAPSITSGKVHELRIRCYKSRAQAFVLFNNFFTLQDQWWTWSDKGKITGKAFAISTKDGKASFIRDTSNAQNFLSAIGAGSDMRLRIAPNIYGTDEVVLINTAQAQEYVAKVRASCPLQNNPSSKTHP